MLIDRESSSKDTDTKVHIKAPNEVQEEIRNKKHV